MTPNSRFDSFVKRQQPSGETDNALDWNKEKEEWLTALDSLYSQIAGYLEEYIDSKEITIREHFIEINEENIGVYTAKRIAIDIGLSEVTLTPIGTMLIGSKGRVDVEGLVGRSRILFVDENVNSYRDVIKVNVRVVRDGEELKAPEQSPPVPEKINWVWRIVTSPPSVQFIDLNRDTFLELLMEVSNG